MSYLFTMAEWRRTLRDTARAIGWNVARGRHWFAAEQCANLLRLAERTCSDNGSRYELQQHETRIARVREALLALCAEVAP